MSLLGLPLDLAFAPGDLVFTGVRRGPEGYSNLILTVDPPEGPPDFSETFVHLSVRNSAGLEVATQTYLVTSTSALVVVDFLGKLDVPDFQDGSVWLSAIPPEAGGTGQRFAAVVTVVEPHRALAIQGTRLPIPSP